ncbi:ANTAR domain-containing protein [Streptomyces sp. NPDC059785]|uniref:ANTAR domain-containing protein n=1 Tax=Streptomyces sp. NPDC059785 TaxID=3346945 RepID=UPI003663D573
MPHDVSLAQAVLDLSSRPAESDPRDMLHDLTTYAVRLLGVRSAGVTVLDAAGRLDHLTASDDVCARLEQDQHHLGEGPGVDSTRTAGTLHPRALLPHGPAPERWPRFAPRAAAAGYTSAAAVPLRTGKRIRGALNLLHAGPGALQPAGLQRAQMLADAAAIGLHYHHSLRARDETICQLESALHSRIVIEQAKGVLACRLGTDMEDAFHRLRAHARSRQHKLTDLARHVIEGDIPAGLDTTR